MPKYCFGYADKGTYEPIPLVGEWWGDDFMPRSWYKSYEYQAISKVKYNKKKCEKLAEKQREYYKKNREKCQAYAREYYKKKRGLV